MNKLESLIDLAKLNELLGRKEKEEEKEQKKDEKQNEIALKIYNDLKNEGVDVLLDNRDERPGVKFKDMDLIGIPLRITVGKKIAEGKVEVKERIKKDFTEIEVENVLTYVKEYLEKNYK